jgi:hypothetical protein
MILSRILSKTLLVSGPKLKNAMWVTPVSLNFSILAMTSSVIPTHKINFTFPTI